MVYVCPGIPIIPGSGKFAVIPRLYADGFMDAATHPTAADPTAQGVISVLSIVVNVVVFAAIIKRSMKLKKNPYKDEIWKGTKDYEEAMSRAE